MRTWLLCLFVILNIQTAVAIELETESYNQLYEKYKQTGGAFINVPAVSIMKMEISVQVPENDAKLAAKFIDTWRQEHLPIDSSNIIGIHNPLKESWGIQDALRAYCQEIYNHLAQLLNPIPQPANTDTIQPVMSEMALSQTKENQTTDAATHDCVNASEQQIAANHPHNEAKVIHSAASKTPEQQAIKANTQAHFKAFTTLSSAQEDIQDSFKDAEYLHLAANTSDDHDEGSIQFFKGHNPNPPSPPMGGDQLGNLMTTFSSFLLAYETLKQPLSSTSARFILLPQEKPSATSPSKFKSELMDLQKFVGKSSLPAQFIQLLFILCYTLMALAFNHTQTASWLWGTIRKSTLYNCLLKDIEDLQYHCQSLQIALQQSFKLSMLRVQL
jgi:hypothetical protein